MDRIKNLLAAVFIAIGVFYSCTASLPTSASGVVVVASSDVPGAAATPLSESSPEEKDNTVADDVSIFVLIGGAVAGLSTLIGSIAGLVAAIRKFKQTKIDDYIAIAEEAEKKRLKAYDDRDEAYRKRDEISQQLEDTRDELLRKKNEYFRDERSEAKRHGEELRKMSATHRAEMQDIYDTLLVEIHVRHEREQLLAEHGIKFEHSPPPYTEEMKNNVTAEDYQHISDALNTGELPVARLDDN